MSSYAGALVISKRVLDSSRSEEASSEALLIDRCRKQDEQAFAQFIDLYQARVFGFIKRMTTNAEEAADLTQEVFIRAYQHFPRFDLRSSVKTWLFKIAHNLCIDHSRKVARTPDSLSLYSDSQAEDDYEIADFEWEPERVAIDAELARALEDGISKMSEKLRSVLLMHDREDMAYDEIASILSIPVGTVKSRLFLARAFLQNELAPRLKSTEIRN